MPRRLFTVASAVSLVLCVGTVVLWVRSYWANDQFIRDRPTNDWFISNLRGEVYIDATRPLDESNQPIVRRNSYYGHSGWHYRVGQPTTIERLPGDHDYFWNYEYGFGYAVGPRWQDDHRALLLPHWFIAVVALILPALWTLRRLRRPLDVLVCRVCRYDLRATPEDQSRYPLNYAGRFGADRGH